MAQERLRCGFGVFCCFSGLKFSADVFPLWHCVSTTANCQNFRFYFVLFFLEVFKLLDNQLMKFIGLAAINPPNSYESCMGVLHDVFHTLFLYFDLTNGIS